MKQTDYLVIGAGIAGLTAAYHLKDLGKVTILTKGKLKQANSYWAQGGIAAVLTKEDRFVKHIDDTLSAGAEHGDRDAIRHLVEGAPKAIRFLESIGVKFKKEPGLEGGHSEARVWRTSDFTGQDVLNHLIKAVQSPKTGTPFGGKVKNIEVLEDVDAVELITEGGRCKGAFIRVGDSHELEPFLAKHTILATGGLGQIFEKTSNPRAAGGDGLAMAANVGLELEDLEFVQFHPTALNKYDEGRYFLLSETLRGFGAKVLNSKKESFLSQFDPRGELAPRDIVTRAIFFEMMNGPAYLDMHHLFAKEVKNRFPNITKRLKHYGLDLTKDLIPITPVAHFSCGGIPVDQYGNTKLPGLLAVGDVACSGVHGANRLASNALLEGLVFGDAIAKGLERKKEEDEDEDEDIQLDEKMEIEIPKIVMEPMEQVRAYAKRISQIMWERVGIIRRPDGLEKALKEITEIPARDYRIQHRQIVCYKMIQAAIQRPSSLGCHYISSEMP
ncbi:L-aspartate oxidase [Candidatus Pacearchaeota archaeon]|nr:L-aspartate oxidase [Candidatus Pacearchaeota archaeon]